eukprot:TRINITY_DN88030_c0_g1_i1.p1 TRINITY_DN88030_c0_g1~~TRINITY_DN88030_c0_g1_i1.p1  ORF type:complete len:258 (-),score=39.03 TRINITY_DN88030_c0_g1_i1:83-856(-)
MNAAGLAPQDFSGHLRKRRASAMGLCRYNSSFYLLKDGWLFWSASGCGESDCEDDRQSWTGWINLSLTPCEVEPIPGNEVKFVLKPAEGCRWNCQDPHGAAGTSSAMVFDVTGSEHSVGDWLASFSRHIAYSRTLPAPNMRSALERLEVAAASSSGPAAASCGSRHRATAAGPCPICFEDIRQGQCAAKTHCGHTFHKECLAFWLESQMRPRNKKPSVPGSCPCCRSVLVDHKIAEAPGPKARLQQRSRSWSFCSNF